MGRKALEKMSQRAYAKYLGISNEAVSKAVREGRIKAGWNAKEKKIIVEKADKEFGCFHKVAAAVTDQSAIMQQEKNTQEAGISISTDAIIKDFLKPVPENTTTPEAIRKRMVAEAEIKRLELLKLAGIFVEKDQVFAQLFAFGQKIRVSILTIPDRTIDNILASKTRAEAHGLLVTELHKTLEGLTNANLDFTPRP